MPNIRKNNLTILLPIPFKTNTINGKFIPLHDCANIKIQQDSGKPLIQKRAGKKGSEAFEFEIKIYQHIKSNEASKEKAILLPEKIENLPHEPTLYFTALRNFGPEFFQEKMGNKNINCIKDDPLIILHLTGWKKYHAESQAADSSNNLQILHQNKDKNADRLTQWEFLKHGVMSMLAPLGERYKAKRLAKLQQLFKKHFSQPNENDSQQFITDLLKASSQNVHQHSKPSCVQP